MVGALAGAHISISFTQAQARQGEEVGGGGGTVNPSEMEPQGSKTLLSTEPQRQPSWFVWTLMKGTRLLMLTVLWSGLGMGAGLFGGIVVLLALGILHHRLPPMDLAYRYSAIPAAIIAGSGAFTWNLMRTVQAAVKRGRQR